MCIFIKTWLWLNITLPFSVVVLSSKIHYKKMLHNRMRNFFVRGLFSNNNTESVANLIEERKGVAMGNCDFDRGIAWHNFSSLKALRTTLQCFFETRMSRGALPEQGTSLSPQLYFIKPIRIHPPTWNEWTVKNVYTVLYFLFIFVHIKECRLLWLNLKAKKIPSRLFMG